MEFLKNLKKWYSNFRNKKCSEEKCADTTCCKEVEEIKQEKCITPEVKSGLPIENYIPQVETENKTVVSMSPVSVVETPALVDELSPAERVVAKEVAKKKPYKKPYKKPAKKSNNKPRKPKTD